MRNNQDSSVKWKTAAACNDAGLGNGNETVLEKIEGTEKEMDGFELLDIHMAINDDDWCLKWV